MLAAAAPTIVAGELPELEPVAGGRKAVEDGWMMDICSCITAVVTLSSG